MQELNRKLIGDVVAMAMRGGRIFIKESVGFAGVKMARRVFGVAGVEEIRGIEDSTLRAEAEDMVLKIARKFVMNYENINNLDEITKMIKNAR